MKITALLVLKCDPGGSDPVILANATDVSHFGFFQRSSVKEFIVFVGRTVARRTPPGQRQSVQHEEYKVHAYNRNGLCALGFMDDHYPVRSAFSLLNQIPEKFHCKLDYMNLEEIKGEGALRTHTYLSQLKANWSIGFKQGCCSQRNLCMSIRIVHVLDEYQKNFGDSWRGANSDSTQSWPYLTEALNKFQDPAEADKLLKIQRELDETKIILHKTIDSVLERGEKLDSLVEKSSDLSASSQMFYKQAKKTNQCCTLL